MPAFSRTLAYGLGGALLALALLGWAAARLPVRLELLWTDALVFVLVGAFGAGAWVVSRHEYLRAPWRQVLRRRMAACALVILGAYTAIGLLDSVHYRPALPAQPGEQRQYAAEVLSLFDVLCGSLRTQVEKTYSEPFATRLYSKELVILPDGRQVRDYPRLVFGGAHLGDAEQQRAGDIAVLSLWALGKGLAACAALFLAVVVWLARRERCAIRAMAARVARGNTDLPWRVVLLTAMVLVLLVFWCAELGTRYHLFGTDKVGQDVFYQCLKSIRTGLVIGTLTTLIMLPFALLLGVMAGYFRGWIDDAIQYVYTTLNSIPAVLLIAAAVLLVQVYISGHPELFETAASRADARLLFLCMILGVTSWTGLCRLLRGESLKLRELDYVLAARAFGVRDRYILLRHILPNVMHIVLITVVLDFSGLVLAEAVLSYVGVGVDPSMFSWGNMINSARLEMAREPVVWWSLSAAFVLMFVLVLAANLFADAVRDAFDPRFAGRVTKS